jgi:hypothetical protein
VSKLLRLIPNQTVSTARRTDKDKGAVEQSRTVSNLSAPNNRASGNSGKISAGKKCANEHLLGVLDMFLLLTAKNHTQNLQMHALSV